MSRYKINNLEEYFKEYKKSVREPRKFWDKIASENFTWYQEWEKVVDFNMEANIKWFVDAKVNITKIVLTDTLPKKRQNRNHFEPNDPSEEALHISYTELHQRVCKMANVLQEQGVEKEIVFVSTDDS
jgi:acetyl-CoA synthetase